MKTTHLVAALACGAALLAGCGDGTGILIRPVPLDQRLQQATVQSDPGWYLPRIALIDVDGLLLNHRGRGLFASRENPVSLFQEKLDKAGDDSTVKAVILRINSPGGTVQASETMHGAVERFARKTGKPVVACITDVGASGAYYLACATGKIISQPSSITGSIGVVIQTVSFAGTMKMLGISAEAIASGKLKTMGSPLKDLSDEERDVFQGMVKEFYDRFVAVVAEGRTQLTPEKARELADGRVYTGRQALKLGLVDKLGGLQEAVEEAKKAAGFRRARVVMYHRPHGYRANVHSAGEVPLPMTQINLVNLQAGELMFLRRPSFLYLWSTDVRPAGGK